MTIDVMDAHCQPAQQPRPNRATSTSNDSLNFLLTGHWRGLEPTGMARPGQSTTDGCGSGLVSVCMVVSDQFSVFSKVHGKEPPSEKCCVVHSIAYYAAGTSPIPEKSFENRTKAHQALRDFVVQTGKTTCKKSPKFAVRTWTRLIVPTMQ